MHRTLAGLLIALLLCTSCNPFSPSNPSAAQNTATDYAVYKALIEAIYANQNLGMVVIKDHTYSGFTSSDARVFELMQKAMPELDQSARDSYLARNARPVPLENRFNLTVTVTLLNQTDFDSYFGKSGKGWDDFYFKYPLSQGVLTLSRAGFNASGDKALVVVNTQAYTMTGAAYAVILGLENGLWKIVNQLTLWTW